MVLYAGIVRDGRDHMFFTMDEVALIDGLIATYFVADSVSESVRIRYYKTHQHLQDNRTDYADLRNIKEALFLVSHCKDAEIIKSEQPGCRVKCNWAVSFSSYLPA